MPNPANLDDFILFDALPEAASEEATKDEGPPVHDFWR
jgi:hypothetical protein